MLPADTSFPIWEEHLRYALKNVELVSELDITEEDRSRIGTRVRAAVVNTKKSHRDADIAAIYRTLVDQYPAVLLVYLVATGLFCYKGGHYWEAVEADFPDLPQSAISYWRSAVARSLVRFGLPTFSYVDEPALSFVTPILMHGGLPISVLDQVLETLILPAQTRPEWVGLTAGELLREWISAPATMGALTKPVQRFLKHGGRFAEQTIEDLCLLLQARWEGRAPQDSGAGHVAQYELDAVEKFLASIGDSQRKVLPVPYPRFRRPQVRFDQQDLGVHLWLPMQVLAPETAASSVVWRLEVDGQTLDLIPDRFLTNGVTQVAETAFRFLSPPMSARAALVVDGETIRGWDWRFKTANVPCYAFDDHRNLLVEDDFLPGGGVWLVVPNGTTMTGPSGAASQVNGIDPVGILEHLGRGWQDFHALHVQVRGLERLTLHHQEAQRLWRIADAQRLEPILAGAPEVAVGIRAVLPEIVFPAGSEAVDWHMQIQSVTPAFPHLDLRVPADQVRRLWRATQDSFQLSLDPWLPQEAVGEYRVILRPGQGRAVFLRFAVLPGLTVTPDRAGGGVTLKLPTWVEVITAAAQRQGVAWFLPVTPGHRHVTCSVQVRPDGGQPFQLDFDVVAPEARWTLLGLAESRTGIAWHRSAIRVSQPELSAATPELLMEFPADDGGMGLVVLQVRRGESIVAVRHPDAVNQVGKTIRRARFDLASLQDELRDHAGAALSLVIEGKTLGSRPCLWDVARVYREWRVEGLLAEAGAETLSVRWQERQPIADRHAWLWDLWRPWRAPINWTIPDNAHGAVDLPVPSDLIPGAYRLQLGISDPWDPQPTVRPLLKGRNTCEVMVGDEASRYERVTQLGDSPLERAERFIAAAQVGLDDLPSLYYLELGVTDADVLPLLLTLDGDVQASKPALQAWREWMGRILCDHRAWDVLRLLTEGDDPMSRAGGTLPVLMGLGWFRRVGPKWSPGACRTPDGDIVYPKVQPMSDGERRRLWQRHPVLAMTSEPWPWHDETIERMRFSIGQTALDLLAPWHADARIHLDGGTGTITSVDGEDAHPLAKWSRLPQPGLVVQMRDGSVLTFEDLQGHYVSANVPDLIRSRPEQDLSVYLGLGTDQFTALVTALKLTPAGPLSVGADQMAAMEWLKACALEPGVSRDIARWALERRIPLRNALSDLRRAAPDLRLVADEIGRRLDPQTQLHIDAAITADPRLDRRETLGKALTVVPYVTGCAALLARALAWQCCDPRALPLDVPSLDEVLLQAYAWAPAQVMRDLCVVDVLIAAYCLDVVPQEVPVA